MSPNLRARTQRLVLACLLEEHEDFIADAIAASRDKAVRPIDYDGNTVDRDSSDVLDDLIAALRTSAP